MTGPRISTSFTYRGLEAAFLENAHLRVLVLPGKGGDILEFRDKRTDVDVLWHAPHRWEPPADRYVPSVSGATWIDHYPGGWQVNVPVAGHGAEFSGATYGLHGESALLPFSATVARDDSDGVALDLRGELVRYPFVIERRLSLLAAAPQLRIEETITNHGEIPLEFVWQHHVALGRPLVDPTARLAVPARTGTTDTADNAPPNGRLMPDTTFEWPSAPARDGGHVDLSDDIPPHSERIADQAYATDLEAGWYALTNPGIDLGFGLTFPTDPFESVWYWQAFGGEEGSPFFGREYTAGLEPTTAYPGWNIPHAQRANETMKTLSPGESTAATFTAVTFGGVASVEHIAPDGTVITGE